MTKRSVESVVAALEAADVRYLIVGGLAVVAHGYLRFTADLDLVLDPDPSALRRAIDAFTGLGYRPRVPVAFDDFADPGRRAEWRRDKGMLVFTLQSADHAWTEVDLFLESPFDFEAAFGRAVRLQVAPGAMATVVGFDDLLEMKRKSGRPIDLSDLAMLEERREDPNDG
jgi:hypothetical protein